MIVWIILEEFMGVCARRSMWSFVCLRRINREKRGIKCGKFFWLQPRWHTELGLLPLLSPRFASQHFKFSGFLSGASGKESAYQYRRCKRCGFEPWVRKIPWWRKWQPTPVFLPGKSHGQKSLVGSSPWSCRVRHDWATKLNWTDSEKFGFILINNACCCCLDSWFCLTLLRPHGL